VGPITSNKPSLPTTTRRQTPFTNSDGEMGTGRLRRRVSSPREGSWNARQRKRPDPAPARKAHPRQGRRWQRRPEVGLAACRVGNGNGGGAEVRGGQEDKERRKAARACAIALHRWSGSHVTPSQHGLFLFLVFARV
jgi:hypothetical protein